MSNKVKHILFNCLFLIALSFICQDKALADERWVLIVQSKSGINYHIDAHTLVYKKNIASAWYKIVPKNKIPNFENLKEMKFFASSLESYQHHKVLCEIDCSNNKLRILVTNVCDKDEKILQRVETLTSTWAKIPDRTCYADIKTIVCKR